MVTNAREVSGIVVEKTRCLSKAWWLGMAGAANDAGRLCMCVAPPCKRNGTSWGLCASKIYECVLRSCGLRMRIVPGICRVVRFCVTDVCEGLSEAFDLTICYLKGI